MVETSGGVELVLIGADGGPERGFGGSALAGRGAEVLAQALPPVAFDAGNRASRVSVVPPRADANTMLTVLRDAARREGRWLVVALLGQLVLDPRGRRLALVTADSTPDNAYRRGLAWDWVVSTMVHGGQEESLLLVDLVAAPPVWEALASGDHGAAELLAHSRVPLWGRVGPWAGGRRGRSAILPGAEGSFSWALGRVLERGVPGAPASVGPAETHPAVAAELAWGDLASGTEARLLVPPSGGRLRLRNRAAVRGALAGLSVSEELLAVLWRESAPTDPASD
ncbi:hypothetical protein C7C46_21415 [Streptomyces tateyamensis]|uniref:Uncharacterized protein n=1 Tax=Streptomyces tateyamensis TaxID=565073 RepID=A0A2V4MZ94_9ACTN|nr:hypothetical protein [Streptomyces tateyamensis]PYC76749.1 hypothetical protein C7C46_21415 [Streptomyces tateyamensis]